MDTKGYHLTIKDLPADLRPRERLRALGPESLSLTELLAIIIRTGQAPDSALDLAQRLLAHPTGIRYLMESKCEELAQVKGIGEAKAAQIKAAVELGRRVLTAIPEARATISNPADAVHLLLNTKNQVLAIETVSVGSLNSSIVHPREVFKNPLKRSAAALVLVHNHPSGDPAPSREDLDVTKRLVEAGKILGIEVLDHIIIGDQRYISLKEEGLI